MKKDSQSVIYKAKDPSILTVNKPMKSPEDTLQPFKETKNEYANVYGSYRISKTPKNVASPFQLNRGAKMDFSKLYSKTIEEYEDFHQNIQRKLESFRRSSKKENPKNPHFKTKIKEAVRAHFLPWTKTKTDYKVKHLTTAEFIDKNFFKRMEISSYLKTGIQIDILSYLLMDKSFSVIDYISYPEVAFGEYYSLLEKIDLSKAYGT